MDVPVSQELLIKQALTTLDNSIVLLSVLLKLHRRSWNQVLTSQRKKVEIRFESVPVVTNPDELVGKRVEHLTFDYEGKVKWYKGTVICTKPYTESELVIRYDCEYTLYCFAYSDFENELVKLLHLLPQIS